MFEDLVESHYLDSHIKDDFQCDQDCYTQYSELTKDDHPNTCTHDYQHIAQNINDLSDNTQQNNLYSSKEGTSLFTDDSDTETQMTPTQTSCQNNLLHIHKENMHTEILLVMHTYSIMTLTIRTCSHLKTNLQHYYNRNYKTHTGICMTQ